jgi:hypothetical protein
MDENLRERSFSVHLDAHEGHEEWTAKVEKRPNIKFSSFVRFVTFVAIVAG